MCPDSPLTLEGVQLLSEATPSTTSLQTTANSLSTVLPGNNDNPPPAPQAPSTKDKKLDNAPPLPPPSLTRTISTEDPSVSRGRETLQQVMIFPIKTRLEGWPVDLVDFNLRDTNDDMINMKIELENAKADTVINNNNDDKNNSSNMDGNDQDQSSYLHLILKL